MASKAERVVRCDPAKRALLLATRGIDLLRMDRLFDDEHRLESIDDRQDYGEIRRVAIGRIDGFHFTAVYTVRDDVIWFITAWPSNRKERDRYEQARRDHLQDRT